MRNDEIAAADDRRRWRPSHIVISPGPCTPNEAGISLDVISTYAGKMPILGVCLGHQSIGQAFGGKVVRAARVMHGKTSPIFHDGKGVFAGPAQPVRGDALPFAGDRARQRARLPGGHGHGPAEGEIMGVRHRTLAVEGVQFHPESFLTTAGKDLLRNFI